MTASRWTAAALFFAVLWWLPSLQTQATSQGLAIYLYTSWLGAIVYAGFLARRSKTRNR